jgi:hypothetical protein
MIDLGVPFSNISIPNSTEKTKRRTLMLSMMPSRRHRIRGPHRSHSLQVMDIREEEEDGEGYELENLSSSRFAWVQNLE